MHNLLLLGYGEMGPYALDGLSEKFKLQGVVLPPEETRFYTKAAERITDQAHQKNIPVFNDNGLKGLHNLVESISPEAVVICSYDKIIPAETLQLCPFINIHHGDLPRYRGRANLNWAIINSREDIGITVHEAISDLDAGGIYHQWKIPISSEDYIGDLYQKVNEKIRNELPLLIEEILQGEKIPVKQQGEPTYCCTRLPEDGKINWSDSLQKKSAISSEEFPSLFQDHIRHLERQQIISLSGEQTCSHNREDMREIFLEELEGFLKGRVSRSSQAQALF